VRSDMNDEMKIAVARLCEKTELWRKAERAYALASSIKASNPSLPTSQTLRLAAWIVEQLGDA
jgi:hypothetical protein